MKLSTALDAYYTHSGNASSVARQAAFAGIAIIWIFSQKQSTSFVFNLPEGLLWPSMCFIVGLGLDLLQYIFSSVMWGAFHWVNEKNIPPDTDPDIPAPAWLNWPALACFIGKLFFITGGYIFLFSFAVEAIHFSNT